MEHRVIIPSTTPMVGAHGTVPCVFPIWYSASFVKNYLICYGGIPTKIGAMIVL